MTEEVATANWTQLEDNCRVGKMVNLLEVYEILKRASAGLPPGAVSWERRYIEYCRQMRAAAPQQQQHHGEKP